jgi:anthranilate synthase/aminodeoxychorismate synthase-like glutamine amidotransferase
MRAKMILIIDNYDSFTYNLVQYLAEMKAVVKVYRNDMIGIDEIKNLNPSHILISPGPGRPEDAGISKDVINEFKDSIPVLGVCLGHQCIGEVFGGKVISAKLLMHGKTSLVYHNKKTIFKGIKNPFQATRYHSLIVETSSLPDCLEVIAYTKEKEIMGIRHKKYPVWGVQFHPESILTLEGKRLLKNFMGMGKVKKVKR